MGVWTCLRPPSSTVDASPPVQEYTVATPGTAKPFHDDAMNEHIIILGAGASGLAAAVLLARDHGMRVTVYERMLSVDQADEESYPIGINPRGLAVLKKVDPKLETSIDVTNYGKVAGWSITAPKKEIARLKSGTVVGTTRGKVVAELYRAACQTRGVQIVLGAKLVRVDVAASTLTFDWTGNEMVVDYSAARVLDCTGCYSKLRTAVAQHDSTFNVTTFPWEITFRNMFTAPTPPAVNLDPTLHYIFTTAGVYAAVLTGSRWVFSCSVNPALNPVCM